MVLKIQPIELTAKRLILEQQGYFSVIFERPAGFEFVAGDWMDIEFKDRTLRGGRTYSMSSAPTESDLRITFREGISEFKKTLQAIEPGEKLYITQYGNDYDFQLDQYKSSTLIAGGIGIAPFRSMLKHAYDSKQTLEVQLIYMDQSGDFVFRKELERWAGALPGLTVTYIQTQTMNRKKREQTIKGLVKDTAQRFYISGPEGMVEAHEHLLIDMGVKPKNIRIDSFSGY